MLKHINKCIILSKFKCSDVKNELKVSTTIIKRNLYKSIVFYSNIIFYHTFGFQSDTNDYEINPSFTNRNPRNLEKMGLATKRRGWTFQYPTKEFYHRIVFQKTNRHITALVQHSNGDIVVKASTKEFSISKHLYSTSDICAAESVGTILADRCLKFGILRSTLQESEFDGISSKFLKFKEALERGGVDLLEPNTYVPEYIPGIDYDDREAVKSLSLRQDKVKEVCELNALTRKLKGVNKHNPMPKQKRVIQEHKFAE